jgi:crotonobetainyl-CoA:carnitine CoA-transferase CaiB-like acyl-CoA transferase
VADGEATYYLGLNRNKRSVALDLADEGDRELARALGARADVLIESFRPGLMASWGLDGDTLRAAATRGSCPARSPRSAPASARPGCPATTFLLQAMGGLMSVTGEAGRAAAEGRRRGRRPRVRAARGGRIEAALVERERTGAGATSRSRCWTPR